MKADEFWRVGQETAGQGMASKKNRHTRREFFVSLGAGACGKAWLFIDEIMVA